MASRNGRGIARRGRALPLHADAQVTDCYWRIAAVCLTSLFRLSIIEEQATLRPRRRHSRWRLSGEAKAIGCAGPSQTLPPHGASAPRNFASQKSRILT